ncbi:MAG: cupin domain-containing protein [Pseudomonadales bacterium]|nr:cupin domain-containing protein [Pseudomonadales bacterium]
MSLRISLIRLLLIALATAVLAGLTLYNQNNTSAQEVSQPLAVNLDELEWGPPGGGNGTPLGLRTARQGVDPVNGGVTYYAMFPAGTHFDTHWHTFDEHVAVVKGELTIVLGDKEHHLKTGSYVLIPGKLNHSWDIPAGGSEAIILVSRRGPADFHFVDQ